MAVGVLIVDDSFMMRTLLADIVGSDDALDVIGGAEDGRQAVAMVESLKPDVILLDIEMPEMDGFHVMKRIKLTSRAKVIIVSSVAQVGSPQSLEARRLGAVDVIAKPSGVISWDIEEKRGSDIVKAIRKAAGLP